MQKSFFARLFSRGPKQAALPLAIERSEHPYTPPAETPVKAKETPRKRVPSYYISGNHWVVIYWSRIYGRWDSTETLHRTQSEARKFAKATFATGLKTRVVKALIPTS